MAAMRTIGKVLCINLISCLCWRSLVPIKKARECFMMVHTISQMYIYFAVLFILFTLCIRIKCTNFNNILSSSKSQLSMNLISLILIGWPITMATASKISGFHMLLVKHKKTASNQHMTCTWCFFNQETFKWARMGRFFQKKKSELLRFKIKIKITDIHKEAKSKKEPLFLDSKPILSFIRGYDH
jgi:hypothetical protein